MGDFQGLCLFYQRVNASPENNLCFSVESQWRVSEATQFSWVSCVLWCFVWVIRIRMDFRWVGNWLNEENRILPSDPPLSVNAILSVAMDSDHELCRYYITCSSESYEIDWKSLTLSIGWCEVHEVPNMAHVCQYCGSAHKIQPSKSYSHNTSETYLVAPVKHPHLPVTYQIGNPKVIR